VCEHVFVEEHLGIKNGLNRIETAIVLYKAFVLWVLDLENRRELSKSAFRFLENYTKSLINKTLDFSLRKLLIKFGIKNIMIARNQKIKLTTSDLQRFFNVYELLSLFSE
jgi:hypothetical protein